MQNVSCENEFYMHEYEKFIFISVASRLASLWNRGFGQPGNGLSARYLIWWLFEKYWAPITVIYCDFFVFQADGIYDNPLDLMDIKPEFSDEETLNDSNTEPKVKSEALWSDTSR